MKIALDATYSVGPDLSGVGVYSREMLSGLANLHPHIDWRLLYRPHQLRRALREPEPVHARRGILLDGALWRNARLFHGLNQRLPGTRFTRQIATFHDLFVMTAEYSTADFRARFTAQARQAAAEADLVIAVSQFTANQVTALLGVEPARLRVIHHGVRPLGMEPAPREKIVLHVGAVQKRKNLVRLIQAFEAAPADWRLVLAGSFGYGAAAVRQTAEASPCAARITFTGYVPNAELGRWYARSQVFAFPSLDEGFGMPVLEAMAAGLPVIASHSSAVAEVAGKAALLIDPCSVEEIAQALKTLCSDVAARESLIQLGHRRAAEFTWERAVRETFNVYRELL